MGSSQSDKVSSEEGRTESDQVETVSDIVEEYFQAMLETSTNEPATATQDETQSNTEPVLHKVTNKLVTETARSASPAKQAPLWETQELEWLLVSAGRFKLAFPLIGLDSVQTYDKKVTPFSSKFDWLLGVTQIKGSHVRLVDIASYLTLKPGNHLEKGNVLLLNGSSWGLLVDGIHSTRKISHAEMRKPAETGRYGWRLGTLTDPIYTLIDPHRLSEALEDALTKQG